MNKALLVVCIVTILGAPVAVVAQAHGFDPAALTDAGRNSYLELHHARAFTIGNIWGRLSSSQRALHQLLKEEGAVEACKALIRDASPAGKLYGFLGLRFSDPSAFSEEVNRYRSRPPTPVYGEGADEADGKVIFQSGCAQWNSDVGRGVSAIESGEYDDEFTWGAKEFETQPKHNNGLHPTADTLLVMQCESLVAAGDAGRYAADEGGAVRHRKLGCSIISARRLYEWRGVR